MKKIKLDGTYGEGGGQILRSALTLSMITQKPFEIQNIRGKRAKPGLLRQHLTAVKAALEICNASAKGVNLGSRDLTFTPGRIKSGTYRFSVGSAGSCMLVLQTILPTLIFGKDRSEIILEGGTHNPFAPTFHFLRDVYIPAIRKIGIDIEINLEKYGFYPAGGGRVEVIINPLKKAKRLNLLKRGQIKSVVATSLISNLPQKIGIREVNRAELLLQNIIDTEKAVKHIDSPGPGNVFLTKVECDNITETFTTFGEKRIKSETVAERCINDTIDYLISDAAIGEHLADQLIIPLAICEGGCFSTNRVSSHTKTNINTVEKFLNVNINCIKEKDDYWTINVGS